MAVKNPWGDQNSFENMTTKAVKPVVKAIGDTVKAVAIDARQQVTGDYQNSPDNPTNNNQNKPADDPNVKLKQMQQVRQNLEQINNQITAIRQKNSQLKESGDKKIKEEKKVAEEQKKQKEPVWKKFLTGKSGSHESSRRAGG
jgi:hypothetical protein